MVAPKQSQALALVWKNLYVGWSPASRPSDTGVAKAASGLHSSRGVQPPPRRGEAPFTPTKANAPKGAGAKPWVYGPLGPGPVCRPAGTTIARLPKDAQAGVASRAVERTASQNASAVAAAATPSGGQAVACATPPAPEWADE